MKCPFCRADQTEVYNTRNTKFGTQIWRRRRCLACQQAFTTYEAADVSFITVMLPSGKTRPYSRSKLFYGLSEAFGALGDHSAAIDALTATVEAKILDLKTRQVPVAQITGIVLETLRHFDAAAYLRYLSAHTDLIPKAELNKRMRNIRT